MSSAYVQKAYPVQKAADSKSTSVIDSSAQSESLQRKADMANNATQRAESPRPNNTGMPDNLKAGIESLSGFSMDNVRVHYNSSKPATVQALAYTQGTDIHVAPGQEKYLPHEAWHVAQQMAGRVSPTTNINGMPVNDNAALEHEADVMGGKAVQMKSDESKTVQRATIWNGVVQKIDPTGYYYHICSKPLEKPIKPNYYMDIGGRKDRGDDLGPGFYMGDFNFLSHYCLNEFISDPDLPAIHIYYIKQDLTTSNIEDFTLKEKTGFDPDELFQIAMQLGFCYTDENNVDDNQRPLDLLAEEETEKLDEQKKKEIDEQKMEKFEKCVNKICGDKDVKK
ncbi:protein of unknown function [Fibrobacter sp. UWH4]|nr:DUF4157 domain-containing protein [Fibrobacter sp. UWH4]SHL83259.1 protein of unknown function [Fibrobacter sp. UWH4]